MEFLKAVDQCPVAEGHAAIFWLGQAGFLIKLADGRRLVIDPYLSDCVRRLIPEEGDGFKRLMPPVCRADELEADVLLISHEHNDHFDVDAIGQLVREKTQVYTNPVVAAEMARMGFDPRQIHVLRRGETVDLGGCQLLPVDCDHGDLAPEALGFLLDFGFGRLYYAGDTALTPSRLQAPLTARPEVAILPINGAFGNLDGREAARYAGMLGCRVCIPCHFWTFPLHHGDPQQILDAIGAAAPECRLKLLCQGEGYLMGGEPSNR